MRVLLTGARGQVGTEVTRALEGHHELVAHDRTTLDLADPDAIVRAIRGARPEVVVNAAAYTAVDRAETETELAQQINGVAPGVMAEECRKLGALLVHYSTDYVFDGAKREPYVEEDPVAPLNAYGRTKLAGEAAIASAGGHHVILRTSWVYGPHGANFLLTMLRAGAQREELRIVADQHGAPTSSPQLGELTARLLDLPAAQLRERGGIYHAAAAGETTWFGFAQAIFSGHPKPPRLVPIATSDWPTPARRPANSRLSMRKLQAAFGFSPGPWQQGLAEAMARLSGA
jgi:dTDP-4-dehydrorhamnose reductase